jgi:adenine deaminase
MACNITSGWSIDCKDSQGGIVKIFVANGPVEAFAETAGVLTSVTVAGSPLTPADFFEFEVPKQTSSLTETVNASTENGTVFYQQDLILVFNKMEAAKRNQILLMAQNEDMFVVAKDGNNKYWSVGLTRGASLTAGSLASGTAYGDRNGGELTLTGLEPQPMFEVTSTIVE